MKVKYDVSGVESGQDFKPVKPGMYRAKIAEVNPRDGQHGNMLEIVFTVTADSKGDKKVEGVGSKLWTYIYTDYEPQAWRLREFLEAVGKTEKGGKKGEKGTIDTDKMVGMELQVRAKSDTNLDGDYRPAVGKILSLADDETVGEEQDEEEPDEDEDVEDSEEEEGDEEDEDEDAVDLDELSRAELKAFIKEEELDVKIKKAMTDEDVRRAITEEMQASDDPEEEEEEEEEVEEEAEDETVDLETLSRAELKAFIKEEELDVTVAKKDTDDEIRDKINLALGEVEDPEEEVDDEDEDEDEDEGDETPDYSSWDADQLKGELKERGLKLEGKYGKKKAVAALEADDDSDEEPF